MPSTLSIPEIEQLKNTVNSGDISGAYDYLIQRGYFYASWANSVVRGDTIAGISAINYLKDTANDSGQVLTPDKIQSVKHDMAIKESLIKSQ